MQRYMIFGAAISILLLWIAFGVYLFLFIEPFNFSWSRGEIGDFLNGLAALALVIIGPTAYWQYKQLSFQQKQNFEEGVFRTFETLKPELENLSIRIIAKAIKSQTEPLDIFENETFIEWKKRYWEADKTIFLRAMQKNTFLEEIGIQAKMKNEELLSSLKRFFHMMNFLENYLDRQTGLVDEDFIKALKSTEVFVTYEVLKENDSVQLYLKTF